MRAWQFTNTHEPLVLADVPVPVAGPGQVVLDVVSAGLCHSDVGVLEDEGWLPFLPRRPVTMGHEVAGVVAEVGDGVTGWSVGDRVGVCPMTSAGAPGYGYDGGFADKIVVDQVTLVPIPDNVPFALGAAGTDAGMTSHHAVMTTGRVVAGTRLGIIGLGGLGQIGARLGVLAGADVYVAEIHEEVWDVADELGVTGIARSIRDFADRQLDVIVDFAGFGTTTAEAIEAVRFGGRVVQVGMGKLEATISTRDLIIKECELVGCRGGTKDDVAGVYAYFASGQLTPHYTEIDFDDIPDGLDRLARGLVKGRLVARINDAR
jgi:propanol-preferring alcohol dehydrogenase